VRHHRLGIIAAVVFGFLPAISGSAIQTGLKADFFIGKVVPLAPFLEKQGAKLDADAAEQWLALVTEEGKVYTLIKDDGSRMFFKDKGLLNRPMRLNGRLIANAQILQVLDVRSVVNGQLHEVYYWCDTCTIRALEPGDCACCGAKLEFREIPVR
jgi:hypothetical protein